MNKIVYLILIAFTFFNCSTNKELTPKGFIEKIYAIEDDIKILSENLRNTESLTIDNFKEKKEEINKFLDKSLQELETIKEFNTDIPVKQEIYQYILTLKQLINSKGFEALVSMSNQIDSNKSNNIGEMTAYLEHMVKANGEFTSKLSEFKENSIKSDKTIQKFQKFYKLTPRKTVN